MSVITTRAVRAFDDEHGRVGSIVVQVYLALERFSSEAKIGL